MQICNDTQPVRVATLYRFCRLPQFAALRSPLERLCSDLGIRGTLLLAAEGINATVAGEEAALAVLGAHLRSIPQFADLTIRSSMAARIPFRRMKVRVRREIVSMGVPGIDPLRGSGTHVSPRDWNELISDPKTLVVDTRNRYEVMIGTFHGAVDPQTSRFREFPQWVERNRGMLEGRPVAMFCTGGIRCEKATAYVKSVGIGDVYQLKGGILAYLGNQQADLGAWRGECFVFDERVSVGPGLRTGRATLCRACRFPLTLRDRKTSHYEEGVSCPHCHDRRSDEDRERYRERQRQVERAVLHNVAFDVGGPSLGRPFSISSAGLQA